MTNPSPELSGIARGVFQCEIAKDFTSLLSSNHPLNHPTTCLLGVLLLRDRGRLAATLHCSCGPNLVDWPAMP